MCLPYSYSMNDRNGGKMTVLKGVEPKNKIELEDGKYQGQIKSGEVRQVKDKSYSYYDLFIQLADQDLELKVGYAVGEDATINEKMALGRLVKRFTGKEVNPDQDYDLEEIFSGKDCSFIVMENEKGFHEIQKDSVKPISKTNNKGVEK